MAQIHIFRDSFNAGELAPLLASRFQVEKVASGCRQMRNFIPHVHGPAYRRPGMEYMGASAGSGYKSSLRGFNFSTSTGAVLEFHPAGLQVWSNGVRVPLKVPVALPYSEAQCAELQIAQVNDVCYLTHPDHPPRQLTRFADDDWRLSEINWKWPALGDENVRSLEIATPNVSVLLNAATQKWAEFQVSLPNVLIFTVAGADTSTAAKTAQLQEWKAGAWVNRVNWKWTTVAPPDPWIISAAESTTFRVTYTGPIKAGSSVGVTWTGGSFTLDTSVFQPAMEKPVTVPAGEWQVVMVCPSTLPAGAKIRIQRKNSAGAWGANKDLTPSPNQVMVQRMGKFTEATEVRVLWLGERAMAGGTVRIESITYPPSEDITLQVDGTVGTSRTLTASKAIFQPGHVGSFWQITHRRKEAFTSLAGLDGAFPGAESAAIRVSGRWDVYTYGRWTATLYLEQKINGAWETVRSWSGQKDRNVIANGEVDQEVEMRLRISSGNGDASSDAAVPRFVLEAVDAKVNGIVKVVAVGTLNTDGKAATATVDVLTALHSTDATPIWTEGAWSGVRGYPRAVALHGQRLWFGGTKSEPMRLWGSVVNDYVDFRRATLDDSGVSFTPAANQSNALQWMVSHGQDLVLGSVGDEWTISGGTQDGPITPTSVQVQRRSGYGSNYLPAFLLGEVIVFVQRGGRKVRQVAPRSEGTVWAAADLTVLAEHVAKEGITQIAAMHFPQSILWAVTASGKLLGMTYETEQNVFAWHVHETAGLVESVAVVYGVESDQVWLQVNRGGARSIERLDVRVLARRFEEREKLIYADAAKRFEFEEATATLPGLDHLEGQEVGILADGGEVANARVSGGQVVLAEPVHAAVVGIPFTSTLQPTRQDIQLRDGTAQFRRWKIARTGLVLHESLGGEVAGDPESKFERLNYRRTSTPTESAPPLFSGEMETGLESTVTGGLDVVVRTSGMFPLNVGAIVWKGDLYGE